MLQPHINPVPRTGFFFCGISLESSIVRMMSNDQKKAMEAKVWELMNRGALKEAAIECENLNRQFPDFGPGWHTASQLLLRLGNLPAALTAIDRALTTEPSRSAWQLQRAVCLGRLRRYADLGDALEHLPADKMQTAYQCSALAMLQTQLGRRGQAVEQYQRAISLQPDNAKHYYNVACLQRSLGELQSAEDHFDDAIRLDPTDWESYKIRSDLRKQTPERNHVEQLESLLKEGIDDVRGKLQIEYALAKELEDLGNYERSFDYLKRGSDRRRKQMRYDIKRDLDTIEAIKRSFPPSVFSTASDASDNSEAIFILGMPRTGTTLVERILASHSDVFAAGELNDFAAQLTLMLRDKNADRRISRDEMVASSATIDFRKLGESYIASTRPFTGNTRHFIDKMPLNYLYIGLLHLALPNARIINLRRDPMDTCYAVYKQLFVDAYPFSYDLRELAEYYVSYHRLMEHWHRVLPGVIHTVTYEELVSDIEPQSRSLVAACNLDWQPQCLTFYQNRDASTTASTAQVRQPAYTSSIGKWRNFARQMQPVVDVLNKAGIPFNQPTNGQEH